MALQHQRLWHQQKISAENFQSLKDILRLSPSSTNIQPWHFVIADDEAGKARIAKGTEGMYEFNDAKVKDASHVIVFCSRVYADDEFLEGLLDKEDADGRFAEPKFKEQMHQTRKMFLDIRRYEQKDEAHWLIEQLYLNMGTLFAPRRCYFGYWCCADGRRRLKSTW